MNFVSTGCFLADKVRQGFKRWVQVFNIFNANHITGFFTT